MLKIGQNPSSGLIIQGVTHDPLTSTIYPFPSRTQHFVYIKYILFFLYLEVYMLFYLLSYIQLDCTGGEYYGCNQSTTILQFHRWPTY